MLRQRFSPASLKSLSSWNGLLVALLVLGIGFRCANLGEKVFWVDEVATAVRVAGYTRSQVAAELAEQSFVSVETLQNYQRITPQKTFQDTWIALSKSPEHAPLYFVLVRLWTQIWGSSVLAFRSLSVVFSLLGLGVLVALVRALFREREEGNDLQLGELLNLTLSEKIAFAFMSVSPFFVSYAQEARPYSLWVGTLLLSCLTLLWANRVNSKFAWSIHSFVLILNFYTSLLSLLVALGQSFYILIQCFAKQTTVLKNYGISLAVALIAFVPWVLMIGQHQQQLQDNTTWMREPMNGLAMVAVWVYTLLIPFADFPVSTRLSPMLILGILVSLGLLVLMVVSFYDLCSNVPRLTPSGGVSPALFIVLLTTTTPIVLILIDLVLGGQASATSRYLIPTQLGVMLALTNFFREHFSGKQVVIFLMILVVQIGSCVRGVERSPDYQKSRNIYNLPIAAMINQSAQPTLWVEPRAAMDLLSLSHNLKPNTQIRILSQAAGISLPGNCEPVFLFNGSEGLLRSLETNPQYILRNIYQPELLMPGDAALSLWQLQSSSPSCQHQAVGML